jgi:hypothetical protein
VPQNVLHLFKLSPGVEESGSQVVPKVVRTDFNPQQFCGKLGDGTTEHIYADPVVLAILARFYPVAPPVVLNEQGTIPVLTPHIQVTLDSGKGNFVEVGNPFLITLTSNFSTKFAAEPGKLLYHKVLLV